MSAIESVLHERRQFAPPASVEQAATISGMAAYQALVAEAGRDYEGFWARLAREALDWHKPFTKVLDESNAPFYKWFEDGELNASYNCLDRHVEAGHGERVAVIFEADDGTVTRVTYADLLARACRLANALKARGIGRRATASSSTCRCRSRASSRCRPARASARRTRWCSAASRRSRSTSGWSTSAPSR